MTRRSALALLAIVVFSASASAWASDLPLNYQALFLLRVLAYDRHLPSRAKDVVNILVVYRDGDDGSTAVKNDLLGALEKISDAKVGGLPFHATVTPFGSATAFENALVSSKAGAVYVCPGLDPATVIDVTRRRSVLSFTGVETFVRAGISIGLVARAGKPAILVNLGASRAEGADLDPALLRLAELVR